MTGNKKDRRFKEDVSTPTVLTINGAIFFLRLGCVIGVASLGGAVLIIVIADLNTISYGLSLLSIQESGGSLGPQLTRNWDSTFRFIRDSGTESPFV